MSELILPMLAKPFKLKGTFPRDTYAVEEKLDGHRIMVRVAQDENGCRGCKAWARGGLTRKLPTHLVRAFCDLPAGVYDGELLSPTNKSYGVTRRDLQDELTYAIFDILEHEGCNTITGLPYDSRRALLLDCADHTREDCLYVVPSSEVNTMDQLKAQANAIWDRGGEGVIIKRRSASYTPGRRTDAFMKLKQEATEVLTITGWEPGTTGEHCVAVIEDKDGNETRVKIRDDATRLRVCRDPQQFIGRLLRIDYTERTPDGSYRHPRWDRLEDE